MRPRRNAGSTPSRLWLAIALGALIAAGCGGGDSGDTAANDSTPEDSTAATPEPSSDSTETESAEGGDTGEGTGDAEPADAAASGPVGATVTIGDETFTADQEQFCFAVAGAVSSTWSDGGDISITFDMPPADWEDSPDDWTAPSVRVDDDSGTPRQFRADTEFLSTLNIANAELSVVTSYTVDGSSASGTGMFVDLNSAMITQEAVAVEGSFSFRCS